MRICVAGALVLLFAACQSGRDQASQPVDMVATPQTANQLTPDQVKEGWKLLFNGNNSDGWRIYKNRENNSWEVVDGTLHCKAFDLAGKRSDIMTVEKFENFELSFDWKISRQGNSGVMFRVSEEFDEPYFSGPEYQLLDDQEYPGDLRDVQLTASNYDMHAAPPGKPLKTVGEWNNSRIVAVGKHIEHWLNAEKVLEYDLDSPDWRARKDNSKWKDAAGYGMTSSGHIDFQDHGNEVWFKNIMIKIR